MKEQILALRAEGKTYREIQTIVNCSKSTINYYCAEDGKDKVGTRQKKRRLVSHPYMSKIERFNCVKRHTRTRKNLRSEKRRFTDKVYDFCTVNGNKNMLFTVQDVINKFGENPKCYLTGVEIDIYKPSTYHFDHIVPVSRGGENTIDNLGICTREANFCKRDLTHQEFLQLCQKVVDYANLSVV